MKIGELARRRGVPASTVRYYESVGVLPRPARVSGRRVYDKQAEEALRFVQALQRAGFTLAEVRAFRSLDHSRQARAQWREAAGAKLRELDARIADLVAARELLSSSFGCACGGPAAECALVMGAESLPRLDAPPAVRGRPPRASGHPARRRRDPRER
ncbi:MAG: MerR family transcriptional regulator [Polyangiaceae bacterium]|nr:MerR family transcriptional regulator [Polyangiaceae bacterium]